MSRWAYILADERFDLLEKIALELAKASEVILPPNVSPVREETEIERDRIPFRNAEVHRASKGCASGEFGLIAERILN